VVATSPLLSAFFDLMYLLLTVDNGTPIILNTFEHFHSFIIQLQWSSVKNFGDEFPSFEALHFFFARSTDKLPPTEYFNALDCFFPVA